MNPTDLARYGLMLAALAVPGWGQAVETVVVTARPPDPVGNDAFSVVRLDAGQIDASPQLDVTLEQVPGLSLYRRNTSLSANPSTQGASLRSVAPSASGRALVTLDGVPQNDPFGGWVIWSSLPPEDISGAEIVRGAGAGPYGAGALTGVIALEEASGEAAADMSGGSLGIRRAAAAGHAQWGRVSLFASASVEASDGWIPVSPVQAGPADDKVTLDARNASLRAEFEPTAGTLIATRLGFYQEMRQSGLVGTRSEADGFTASITVAHPESGDALGWRLQAWLRQSGFMQTSASIAPARAFTTPSNDQYATPALGWGANAALRGVSIGLDWEIGADVRAAHGNSKEILSYVSGAFTQGRISGGDGLVGGVYAEAAYRSTGWLFTLGARADTWTSSNGHVIQTNLASRAVTLDQHSPSRSGIVPTARGGVRRDFGQFYLRSAVYEGFSAPSLNELYRPFRLGNNITEANPALTPEKLYGVEFGAGGKQGAFEWNLTAFWNQLHGAISNVTVGHGPATFPGIGFVPTGGLLIQRQNVGDIDAPGLEGDLRYTTDGLALHAAFDFLDQCVHGATAAPQLTGKRPAQAPRATLTGGFAASLPHGFSLSADVRYEGARYADDANMLRLAPAFTLDTRLSWALNDGLVFYVAADNLLDARVATTESADGVTNDGAPRLVRAGVRFKTSP